MSIHLRKFISSRINELTSVKGCFASSLDLRKNKQGLMELRLPLWDFEELKTSTAWTKSINNEIIENVNCDRKEVIFSLNQQKLVEDAFKDPTNVKVNEKPNNYIIEFSSPNIAKPFHMGHLRSTIIGNFLANFFTTINNNVIKMNYLGDYGTQFGFLMVGMEMEKLSREEFKINPLNSLLKAYVTANSSTDPLVAEKARIVFEKMENDEDEVIIKQWEEIKKYTMDELQVIYERLNIVFDVYEFESMYRKKDLNNLLVQLKEKNLLIEDEGRLLIDIGERKVTVVKSDGTTIYLSRDIIAYESRRKCYEVDKTFYVVDDSQLNHFKALKSIIDSLGFDADSSIEHVKFGRIKGMSTRKGSVVFLKDILEEAKDRMLKKQQESETTKVDLLECGDSVADILGCSAVIVNDLKQRRQRTYDFDWDKILQVNGDTGVKLQYTHCRLHSLMENCGVVEAEKIDLKYLQEPEAQHVLLYILKYPEVFYDCSKTLESCGLVNYLFRLCNNTSKALKILNVKNADTETASQRLLLFNMARKILKHGLETLGLKVLTKM